MEQHPDLAPLEFLIGVWRGAGKGRYPTIDPFEYVEEATYAPGPGKPFIAYSQRTRRSGTGEPLHAESGYIRPRGSGRAELVIAQPTGILEVHTGELESGDVDSGELDSGEVDRMWIRFRTIDMVATPTAAQVTQVERYIEVEGDIMRYRLNMQAVGEPLQLHLEAELTRST